VNDTRVEAVREALARHRLDGALLSFPEHVWWLTGEPPVTGAAVLVAMDMAVPVDATTVADAVHAAGLSARRVGTDGGPAFAAIAVEAVDARAVLAEARRGKDVGELAALEHAAHVVDGALAAARVAAVPGASGVEVFAAATEAVAAVAGSDARLEGNVGAGVAGADPDALPSDVPLGDGDWLFVDLYPRIGWYYGDATRAFSVGRPSELAERVHRVLWAAVDHAAEALHPGIAAGEIDARCRSVLARDGLEEHFPHHAGHGLGLFQQEPPMLVPGNPDVLRVGDVVTLEPGVYLPGVGGMRVEDAFVIEEGGARRLTTAARELSMEADHG
jgi:Xaa-Pro aminopeptidase